MYVYYFGERWYTATITSINALELVKRETPALSIVIVREDEKKVVWACHLYPE